MIPDCLSEECNCQDPLRYQQVVLSLERIFLTNQRDLKEVLGCAEKIRDGIRKIDPFIQQANQSVCTVCSDICCVSKHGFYTCEDLIYLFAINLKPPHPTFERNGTDPCPYLRETGCSIERSIRPSHCNWYFCDSLLDQMEPQPAYREFDDAFRDIAELWLCMIDSFRKFCRVHGVQCNHAKTDRRHSRQTECRQIDTF